jgi:hypothetical protein
VVQELRPQEDAQMFAEETASGRGLQHVYDVADNSPIVDPRLAAGNGWQKWGQPGN